jgi:hypothetical protein
MLQYHTYNFARVSKIVYSLSIFNQNHTSARPPPPPQLELSIYWSNTLAKSEEYKLGRELRNICLNFSPFGADIHSEF